MFHLDLVELYWYGFFWKFSLCFVVLSSYGAKITLGLMTFFLFLTIFLKVSKASVAIQLNLTTLIFVATNKFDFS